ncbi:MAG: MFS transporter [Candidatus Thorarchaeota archaeon]
MEANYNTKRSKTFRAMVFLYFMIFYCTGILPVNIDNLLLYLPKTTKFGIGVATASTLIMGIISILIFGYYGDRISYKYSRKKIFIYTNLVWILSFGLVSLSVNYIFSLIFFVLSAIGTGAFLPLGFSMIGDFFSPKDRGKKYSALQFGSILGVGMGIIFGGLLGSYAGPLGWRFAYGLGFIIGLLVLLSYVFSAIEPEQLRSEPEFQDFDGEIKYNYKITLKHLKQLFGKKSIAAILFAVLCAGVTNTTLGIWAIFYLKTKISGPDSELIATTIYVLAGAGAPPGTIIGGRLGDRYYRIGKLKGRPLISFFGLILGISLMMLFYLIPFYTYTAIQIILCWIFFVVVGFLGFLFVSFPIGNQFAIYSEVALPEVRSTANAMNGLMVNLGGIIGNLLISSLIERNIALLPLAVFLVLSVWLFGSLFWVIAYFYYPREAMERRDILLQRRKELEKY